MVAGQRGERGTRRRHDAPASRTAVTGHVPSRGSDRDFPAPSEPLTAYKHLARSPALMQSDCTTGEHGSVFTLEALMDPRPWMIFNLFIGLMVLVASVFTGGLIRTEVRIPDSRQSGPSAPTTQRPAAVAFREELKAQHWIAGLVQGDQPDIDAALRKYVRPGEKFAMLTIGTRRTAGDVVLSMLTLQVYVPVTVVVEGEVVRLP